MTLEITDETYYDITGKGLNNLSQLKLFNILKELETNDKIMNIFNSYEISDEVNSTIFFEFYEAENDEWWDNISYKYYGTVYLWWLIALINGVINPFEYLDDGKSIKILKPEYVYQVVKEIKSIGNV